MLGLFSLVDWGSADWTQDADKAHERYVQHLNQLSEAGKAGWTPELVEALAIQAEQIRNEHSSVFGGGGAEYWQGIATNEPNWILSANLNPAQMGKIDSHIAFLQSAGAASSAWENALAQYGAMNVAQEVAQHTAEDIKRKTDPKQSVWPWIAGAGVAVFLVTSYWRRK
jgi:hypothetical protein